MNDEQKVYQLDIIRIITMLLKRWWVIVLSALIFAGVAFGYTRFFVRPTYSSYVLMFANNNSSVTVGGKTVGLASRELGSAANLIDTYVVVMQSRTTLEKVIDQAGLRNEMTYGALKSSISATTENDTAIFRVTVTHSDPNKAQKIAKTITEVLPQTIQEVIKGTTISIVDEPIKGTKNATDETQKAAIGFIFGAVLAVVAMVLLDFFNDTLYSEEWLIKSFDGIPLLSVIPDVNASQSGKYGRYRKYGYYYKYEYTSGSHGKDSKEKKADKDSKASNSVSPKNGNGAVNAGGQPKARPTGSAEGKPVSPSGNPGAVRRPVSPNGNPDAVRRPVSPDGNPGAVKKPDDNNKRGGNA